MGSNSIQTQMITSVSVLSLIRGVVEQKFKISTETMFIVIHEPYEGVFNYIWGVFLWFLHE